MSDRMRWRYGDTNPVVAPVAADTVIEIGDLVYYVRRPGQPKTCFPAHDLAVPEVPATANAGPNWAEQQAQLVFAAGFLGVAMQRSREGDVSPIRVATTGVFEFGCPRPGYFDLGDYVGITVATENGIPCCQSQLVGAAPTGRHAVARVARVRVPDDVPLLVDIRSTIMTGGIVEHSEPC